ncbi:MAG: winged helix-turn-helix domain-containing protein, partial [Planktomarina sp.]
MTTNNLTLTNAQARACFLNHHLLCDAPSGAGKGADLDGVLMDLAFVQLDSINTAARAHDMILWARRTAYRSDNLRRLVDVDRSAFEAFTHDASILPMDHLPHWQHKFRIDKDRLIDRWNKDRRAGYLEAADVVLDQISKNGPLGSGDVGKDEKRGTGGWWDWHPSKTALEYLWRSGRIMVTRRDSFRKVYDLRENVAPDPRPALPDWEDTVNWACRGALQRLGFATHAEIAAFWELIPVLEAKQWLIARVADGTVTPVDVMTAQGAVHPTFALTDKLAELTQPVKKSNRIRILSPFDPALRDRKRAERLFGFNYRIEVFVPAPKRIYGYYVFPVLEGHKIIGRIDLKANRKANRLDVTAFWPEAKVQITKDRVARLT